MENKLIIDDEGFHLIDHQSVLEGLVAHQYRLIDYSKVHLCQYPQGFFSTSAGTLHFAEKDINRHFYNRSFSGRLRIREHLVSI